MQIKQVGGHYKRNQKNETNLISVNWTNHIRLL